MSHFRCEQTVDLAAEIALGVAHGEDRAHALAHLAQCAECRALIDEMSRAADSLMLLAPQVEPPIGFESRVLARVARRRRVSWRFVAAAALVGLVSSMITGAVVHKLGATARERAKAYDNLAQTLGGKTLKKVEIRAIDGSVVGNVYAYDGKPSWLFLVLEDKEGTGEYRVEIDPVAGQSLQLAGFKMKGGRASWATTAAIDIDRIQAVTILDPYGLAVYDAQFKPPNDNK